MGLRVVGGCPAGQGGYPPLKAQAGRSGAWPRLPLKNGGGVSMGAGRGVRGE